MADYRYLAKITGSSISTSITYILFLTKMQKRQIPEKGSAPIENDITNFFPASELKIHSRYRKSDNKKSRAIADPALGDLGKG